MKTSYCCEICRAEFIGADGALECEAKGNRARFSKNDEVYFLYYLRPFGSKPLCWEVKGKIAEVIHSKKQHLISYRILIGEDLRFRKNHHNTVFRGITDKYVSSSIPVQKAK